ncbi:MAG: hypothetical protein WAM11_03660 [Cyanobium sp.]
MLANYEFVAFCHQDDTWFGDKICTCEDALRDDDVDILLHCFSNFEAASEGRNLISFTQSMPKRSVVKGSDLFPLADWPGMSMVAGTAFILQSYPLRYKWIQFRKRNMVKSGMEPHGNWIDSHDLHLIIAARKGRSIRLIDQVCALHRTGDGGITTSIAGSVLSTPIPKKSRAQICREIHAYCAAMEAYFCEVG